MDDAHVQVSFFTKQEGISIPDTPFSIPVTVTREELTGLINQTLREVSGVDEDDERTEKDFEFLIESQLIRGSLQTHLNDRGILVENVVKIECIERNPPPALSEEFELEDWVSCVHCTTGCTLTGCYNNKVVLLDHANEEECEADGHSAPVKAVKWLRTDYDEELFVSGSQDQNVHIWRYKRQEAEIALLHCCKGHAQSVEALAVSPDRTKFVSVSWDTYLKIWSAVPDSDAVDEVESELDLPVKKRRTMGTRPTTRTPLMTLAGHSQPVTTVLWVGQGEELVSAGWDHCIRLWDAQSGVNKSTLAGSKVFHSIDKNRKTGQIASGHSDKIIRLWDTRQSESSMVQSTLSSHQGWVVSVNWSPDIEHQLLSGCYDGTLKLWDIRSSKAPLYTITAHTGKVLCTDWSLPKLFASGGTDNKLRTYSL